MLVVGILSYFLLSIPPSPFIFQKKNDHVIPLSSLCNSNHFEKLIVTLLMTAWLDVNVPGDSLHCPVFCGQSEEGFQGRGKWGMGADRVGHECEVDRQSFIKAVVISSPFCFVSPALGGSMGT